MAASVIARLSQFACRPSATAFTYSLNRNISIQVSPLLFNVSPCLCAEPLKKKKKLDPAIIKAREERKKKRIEKQIRRLEKHERQLKPIEELSVPVKILDQIKVRKRVNPDLTAEEVEKQVLIQKEWAQYRYQVHLKNTHMVDRVKMSQERALEELRLESEELYIEAIQMDPSLVPFKAKGPVQTPPNSDYDSPDGEYIDTTKKWD